MSVETQIARIRGNIASAYAQAAQKGAQLPAVQNSENLPGTIMGIPAGGLPDDVYTITVESSDQAGGSASGGGVVSRGMTVTVTVEAAAVDGYHFVNWQENGQTVSESASYTFTVTGDRTLTAVFEAEKTSRLPAGYTEVEYIESTNGQYITTPSGIVSSRLVIEVEPTKSFSGTTTQVFFGYCKYTSSVKATYHTGLFRSSAGILGGVGSTSGQLKTLSTAKSLFNISACADWRDRFFVLQGKKPQQS